MAAWLVLGAQFMVKDPSLKGQLPDGEEASDNRSKSPESSSLSLSQALRTRRFFMLCLAYFTVFFCTCVVVIHVAPFTLDLGQTPATAALVLAVIGGASIAGRFILGTIGDKTGSKRALVICFSLFILVFVWLQFTHQLWQLFLFAVFYGFAHGGFYALISPAVAEAFGLRSHGLIFGCIVFVASVGGALGPLLAGYIFDVSNSYNLAFLLLLGFSAAGCVAMLFSGSGKWLKMNVK